MKVLDKVSWILRQGQKYRDSDKELLLAFWETERLYLSDEQKAIFMRCTTAETITRARRALKDHYPASQSVNEERYDKFKQYRGGAVSWL